MIHVFLTTQGYNMSDPLQAMRLYISSAVMVQWMQQPDHWIEKLDVQLGMDQLQRRINADAEALSPIYILADDDCLLMGAESFIQRGVQILENHPEFAILSALPTNCDIKPWQASDYPENDEVFEHTSVGGVRFCRQGVIQKWPPLTHPGYDHSQCEAIRAMGKRCGYLKTVRINHVGEEFSTLWKKQ